MNAIEIHGLTKSYPGFTLGPIDLCLPRGCILGLIGENGAGKSTTIRLILDLIQKDGGTIRLLGRDGQESSRLSREEIGVVMDEVGIPSCLNALQVEKIMASTFRHWDHAAYEALLKKLSIDPKKPFKAYSKGMKMKLGIAVALSHHPKLLILDEATSGLDPVVRDEILDIFADFTREEDHAILLSSHIVSDLEKICDYVAFLHKGQLMLCREKDELREAYAIVRCSQEDLDSLPQEAIIGKKKNPYSVEAIVSRQVIPHGMQQSSVDIEQLFIFMVKEADRV